MLRADDHLATLVQRWNAGDQAALGQLTALLYDDLRRLAHRHLQRERDGHTLSTTALVHEAYVHVAERTGPEWRGKGPLLALLSQVMRHVLVDYARRRGADKRGGGVIAVPLEDAPSGDAGAVELLAVNEALDRLAGRSPRLATIVEYRVFAGLSEEEIAVALDVTTRTVRRDWQRARAYLFAMLAHDAPPRQLDE
jgi:RNA polymerase sigma factor (TIGR02999 family)